MGIATYQASRSYGDKGCGVWLKKKRCENSENDSTAAASPSLKSSSISLFHEDEDTASTVYSSCSTVPSSSSSPESVSDAKDEKSSLSSLAWDDELCRPIYRKSGNGATPPTTDTQEEATNTDSRDNKGEKIKASEQNLDWKGDKASAKTSRSYGRKKVKSSNMSRAAEFLTGMKARCAQRTKIEDSSHTTASSHPDTFCSSTPSPAIKNERSICSLLDSDTKRPAPSIDNKNARSHSALPKLPKPRAPGYGKRKANNFGWTSGRATVSRKKTKQTHSLRQNSSAAVKNTSLDFVENEQQDKNVHQPSSHSSLSAAKAFFDHLDANHDLKIKDSSNRSPAPLSKPCVRTSRITNSRRSDLRREYLTYCRATVETGISPLSFVEFSSRGAKRFPSSW